jgi:hypothetical protein
VTLNQSSKFFWDKSSGPTGHAATAKRTLETMTLPNGRPIHLVAPAVLLGLYAVVVLTAVQTTHNGVGLGGAPLFYDFEAFYEAGRFALHGDAAGAYDDARMIAAQHAAFPGMTLKLPWNYPPTFQLLLAPLAALPYVVAWILWSVAGYAAFAATLQRGTDGRPAALMVLAPAAAINLFYGQNGLFSAALLCGGISLLDRRPRLAGVLLGLLSCKPQLAVLAPLLLLAGGHWRALVAAVVSQALLSGATLVMFGEAPWLAFLGKLLHPDTVVTSSSSDWRAVPSMMTFARTIGLPAAAASALHMLTAAVAVAAAAWSWRKTNDVGVRAAMAGAATVLISPYLRAYDLALLVPAASLLAMRGDPASRAPRRLLELAAATLAWASPALLMFTTSPVQYGALISLGTLALLAWRLQTRDRNLEFSRMGTN